MALRFDGSAWSIDELAFIQQIPQATDERSHTHRFVELVYILRGKTVQYIDGAEYPALRGDLLFIHEGQLHSMVCHPGCTYINILMKPEVIAESLGQTDSAFSLLTSKNFSEFRNTVMHRSPVVHISGKERTRMELLLDWLLQEQNEHKSGGSLLFRSGLNMLLIQVFRCMELPFSSEGRRIDNRLLARLRENCGHHITLEETAKSCGYDPSYFSRLFRQNTGKTFTAYLQDCRLELACRLLETTEQSVDRIITECGFTDRTRFFRLFAAHYGMTPLQYRKSKN